MTNSTREPGAVFIEGHRIEAPPLGPGLYIVATPIGNLGDISLRALRTLAAADLILCEDTRQSRKLIDHYGIKAQLSPLHEHNERERIAGILQRLQSGAAIALISDAGTPLISDPGFPLVRAAREAGHKIVPLPGASALLAALTSAGLPTDRFTFFGFPPAKSGARARLFSELADRSETLVFYESPRRLGTSLASMAEAFGPDRPAAIALELTKRFERVMEGTIGELQQRFAEGGAKGEAVILVSGATGEAPAEADWQEALDQALETAPLRGAVDEITARFALPRKKVYDAALALKSKKS